MSSFYKIINNQAQVGSGIAPDNTWIEYEVGKEPEELIEALKPTLEQVKAEMEQAIQSHIDSVAKSKGYDNISSIGKYLGYDNPFRIECEKLGLFNSSCWIKAYAIQSEVEQGLISMPTTDEVIEMLPKYE